MLVGIRVFSEYVLNMERRSKRTCKQNTVFLSTFGLIQVPYKEVKEIHMVKKKSEGNTYDSRINIYVIFYI